MSKPTHLVTWRDNKADAREEWEIDKLVDLYFQTEYPNIAMPLERKVSLWLSEHDGPVSGVWDDVEAFGALLDAITERFESQ